jgi:hypothetical protein
MCFRAINMTPDQEAELLRLVREGRSERASVSEDRRGVRDALGKVFNQLALHEQKDELRHEQVIDSLKGANSRIGKLEQDADDTGSHNLAEARSQLAETRKARIDFWRNIAIIVMGAAGTFYLGHFLKW